jgi:hypothetical protein
MKALALGLSLFLLAACQSAPRSVVAQGPDCRPWKASVVVQCWWAGEGLPLTQCERTRSQPPGCGLDEVAVSALTGVTSVRLDREKYPHGTWAWFTVYQDEQGRIGRASADADGRSEIILDTRD